MKKTNQKSIDYIEKMRQKFVDQLMDYDIDLDEEINLRKMIDVLNEILKFMKTEK